VVYHLWTRDHRPGFREDHLALDNSRISSRSSNASEGGPHVSNSWCGNTGAGTGTGTVDPGRTKSLRRSSESAVRELLGIPTPTATAAAAAAAVSERRHRGAGEHTVDNSETAAGSSTSGASSGIADKRIPLGRYGLGSARSLSQFEASIGVRFSEMKVVESAHVCGYDDDTDTDTDTDRVSMRAMYGQEIMFASDGDVCRDLFELIKTTAVDEGYHSAGYCDQKHTISGNKPHHASISTDISRTLAALELVKRFMG
jgi:hypothetical protein